MTEGMLAELARGPTLFDGVNQIVWPEAPEIPTGRTLAAALLGVWGASRV
jgi:hypothetical protein